ncbi:hypothetical protein PV08_11833 [Exophiala spinifera]|uniref:AB hydrolase-1 domain-containing protein n=1 Tax=Exophiala spinifera TaxID=91928 RepID=A0A0D1ZAM8_9EURO|nr:uncharacterized protein PV08_11833 [Exophiala spinifera]KIW10057.1 hypothetical protein PV08_11833 [Exophiala spinifera]
MKQVHGESRFRDFENSILTDRRARSKGEGGKIPFATTTPDTELSVWPFARVNDVFLQLQTYEASLHQHWSTTESAELLLNSSVFPFLARILDVKVCMIVAEGDNITAWDLDIEAFNRIASPLKNIQILPGTSHMSLIGASYRVPIACGEAKS